MTESSTTRRRPNVVVLVIAAIAVLAVVAVVVSQAGGDDDSSGSTNDAASQPQTREVAVSGASLPTFETTVDDPAVGTAAPVLTGESFDGSKVVIGGTGPALVVFFAHWCPHCQREVPFLVSYFDEHGMPEDVDVYGVATGTDPASPNYPPSAWLDREDWPAQTLVDSADDTAAKAYGLSAYPFFVALDADGNVVARGSGELEAEQVDALLEEARS